MDGKCCITYPLQCRHNGRGSVWNHQPHDCLHRSKKTLKLRVTGLCAGNSPVTGEFPHKWPVTRKMFSFDDIIMRVYITKIYNFISRYTTPRMSVAVETSNFEWVICPGWAISGHIIGSVRNEITSDECLGFCLSSPVCKSIDYKPDGGRCTFNDISRAQAGDSWTENPEFVFYEYTCLTCNTSAFGDGQNCFLDPQGKWFRAA